MVIDTNIIIEHLRAKDKLATTIYKLINNNSFSIMFNYHLKFDRIILIKLYFIFSLIKPFSSKAQTNDVLITAINSKLLPLKTLSPDSDFSDLQQLKPFLKDKPIIAIGEATHGTHEFFVYKHRMLEFLVKEMGFKTFVIEADFAGTQTMNDYILYGKGSVYKGIYDMSISVWMTQEFVDMAEWLKVYNSTQLITNKVRFFGCDMQSAFIARQLIQLNLEQTNQFTPEIRIGFDVMKKYIPTLSNKEKGLLKSTMISLQSIEYKNPDTNEVKLYKHNVRQLEQYINEQEAASKFFPARQSDIRDKYMAENCEWIYNYTNKSKMMIWAHNAHIGKAMSSDGHQRMGMYLAASLKDQYYALGFDFNSGKVRAYDTKLKKYQDYNVSPSIVNSSGAIFAQCSSPNFILDFKDASINKNIQSYLNMKISSFFIGADYANRYNKDIELNYVKHKLAETYDGIIFIRETTPSTSYTNKNPN